MPWIDAFQTHAAQHRNRVLENAFGHLALVKNRKYRGYIVFAVSNFGSGRYNPLPVDCNFGDLDSSPWFYDSMITFLESLEKDDGCVYRWEGSLCNYKFVGTVTVIYKPPVKSAQ